MLKRFLSTIEKYGMIQKGDGIVVGVSGGPDSVCLLHLLWKIRNAYQLKIYAVHLNHQLREKEAEEDALYVRQLCAQLDIPAFIYSEDIACYSQKKGISFEEAGRERRYALFDQVMQEQGAHKIAVAQNMDDQAETVLMRFMRGAGIEGLAAIPYVREHRVIRPLLDIPRHEIEAYCRISELTPRLDYTNLQTIYTRNRIRLELIPYIQEHFNPKIKDTLWRTANLLREDSEFIDSEVQCNYEEIVQLRQGAAAIFLEAITKLHPSIGKRIIRRAIREASGSLMDFEQIHIESILNLANVGRVGARIDLPKEMMAEISYDVLIIKKRITISEMSFFYTLPIGEDIYLKELVGTIRSKIIEWDPSKEIQTHSCKKYFDLDKVQGGINVRNRRQGDIFWPYGMKGRKKLKDYFIDEKISRENRDRIPLICDEDEIMWVVGYRTSEKYKIDEHTKRVLILEYERNDIKDR
ncbi:tRNA(Ile)-lysidine synthase [Anaerosolibacter carboniphilus]|uniref:tRNA(Ile)-lysidine synthase n=1 Tax=Anaerosolibacter carboniphilus TaxID=1417629 RepID=A0A841L877_9FIRM|nr:tRNA lysidine(34) synthetase TilS [Anaerosolibacter carboniphilus]MBB6218475.1 tRNA(Ile)-lysidine synthase [Anaerosolibacter carboniphilus]